jgi:fructose/tagatose bisphosphate aldolase
MIISSQRYLDNAIVTAKMEELAGKTEITLETWEVGEIDGEEMEILFDGHHTFCAAKELGITVKFEKISHPEKLTGIALLEASWMDANWYDIETEIDVF